MKYTRFTLRFLTALMALGTVTWSVQAADSGDKSGRSAAVPAVAPAIGYAYDQAPIDRTNRVRLTSYADVLDKVTPAVVSVYTTSRVTRPPARGRNRNNVDLNPMEEGVGSGSIITADGYILTNHHVVTVEDINGERPADSILVKLSDGRDFTAKFVGSDKSSDVALLKIEGKNFPAIKLADSAKLRVGDVVFAIGNPMDVGLTVTQGIVSATGRSHLDLLEEGFEDFIQTDASINPGNSGGPLVDADGRLIGLNSAILSPSSRPVNMGIGFAVPSVIARHVVDSLIRDGRVRRGIMGVDLQSLDHDLALAFGLSGSHGALVNTVRSGTPAERAGLVRGDIVIKLNDEEIDSAGKLRYLASMTTPGEKITLSVVRDGQPRTIKLQVADREEFAKVYEAAQQDRPRFILVSRQRWENIPQEVPRVAGAAVMPLDDEVRNASGIPPGVKGVIVVGVNPQSPLSEKIPEGAIIIQANNQPVYTARDLDRVLKTDAVNVFYYYYRDRYVYAAASLAEK